MHWVVKKYLSFEPFRQVAKNWWLFCQCNCTLDGHKATPASLTSYKLPTDWAGEPTMPSKNAGSLLASTKKIGKLGFSIFWSDATEEVVLRFYLAHIDWTVRLSRKRAIWTWKNSTSLDPLVVFPAFVVGKLWSENNKFYN